MKERLQKLMTGLPGRVVGTLRRYPVTLLLMVVTFFSLLHVNHVMQDSDARDGLRYFLLVYPASAMLLSLMLHLCTQNGRKRYVTIALHGGGHALWLGLCVYWALHTPTTASQNIALGACCAAMLAGCFVLPFLRHEDDLPAVRFLIGAVGAGAIALIAAGTLYLGLVLLFEAFRYLFHIEIANIIFIDMAIFSFTLVAPALCLLLLPTVRKPKTDADRTHRPVADGFVRYLLIPLQLLYTLTLYAYALKILVTFELPDGWVSYLVSILVFLTIINAFGLYPAYLRNPRERLSRLVMRIMPPVVLPLLMLMSVGIGRRLSDYGLTVMRVYLVLFNLWCYAVCIGLIVLRGRRLMWLISSFVITFLLVSLLPYNVCSFTRSRLQADVERLAGRHGVTHLPMDAATYGWLIQSVGYDDAARIDGKLDYLRTFYPKDATDGLLKTSVQPYGAYRIDRMFDVAAKNKPGRALEVIEADNRTYRTMDIPQGYRQMLWMRDSRTDGVTIGNGELRFTISRQQDGRLFKDVCRIPLAQLQRYADNPRTSPPVMMGERSQLVLTNFRLLYGDRIEDFFFDGCLFIK